MIGAGLMFLGFGFIAFLGVRRLARHGDYQWRLSLRADSLATLAWAALLLMIGILSLTVAIQALFNWTADPAGQLSVMALLVSLTTIFALASVCMRRVEWLSENRIRRSEQLTLQRHWMTPFTVAALWLTLGAAGVAATAFAVAAGTQALPPSEIEDVASAAGQSLVVMLVLVTIAGFIAAGAQWWRITGEHTRLVAELDSFRAAHRSTGAHGA